MMIFLKFACGPSLRYYRETIQQAEDIHDLNLFVAFFQGQASETAEKKTAAIVASDEEFLGLDQEVAKDGPAVPSNVKDLSKQAAVPVDLDDETYLQLGIPDEEQLKKLEKQLMGEDQEYLAIVEGEIRSPLQSTENCPVFESGFMALPPKNLSDSRKQQAPPRLDSGILALPIKKNRDLHQKDKPPMPESGIIDLAIFKPVGKPGGPTKTAPVVPQQPNATGVEKAKLLPLLSSETKKKILGRIQRYASPDEEMQSAQIHKAVKILQKIQSEDIADDQKAAIVTRKLVAPANLESASVEIGYTDDLPETFDYLQFEQQNFLAKKGYQILGISAGNDHDFLIFSPESKPEGTITALKSTTSRDSHFLFWMITFTAILVLGIVLGVAIARWIS